MRTSENTVSGRIPLALHQKLVADRLQVSPCPACGDQVAVPFMDEEYQPLATLAWPKSRAEAEAMKRLPLAFVRCAGCGHVYNIKFRYEEVPYSLQPNLMFNQGIGWSKHIEFVCNLLMGYLPANPTVVEIGCGDGQLLAALSQLRPSGTYIGFDPSAANSRSGNVELRGELFVPECHLAELRPQMLVSRHVLEHMLNPLGFLQAISLSAKVHQNKTLLYTEVPCIDRVFENGRVEDFYYEHNSHFTTESFNRMLHRSNAELQMLVHHYNREVISGIVCFGSTSSPQDLSVSASQFRQQTRLAKQQVARQLADLHQSGFRVAIWGGTGKGAAFMNFFGVDADRFPFVVDSDPAKLGTHVPGTGQEILSQYTLLQRPVDIVIIPTQWRANDIVAEMAVLGIQAATILIEHQGRLIDYRTDEHPY